MLTWEYRRNFLSPTLIWHMQGATATNKNILHLSVFRIESILKLTRWFKYRLLACHFLHGCFTHTKLCIESQGSSNRKKRASAILSIIFCILCLFVILSFIVASTVHSNWNRRIYRWLSLKGIGRGDQALTKSQTLQMHRIANTVAAHISTLNIVCKSSSP